jgi:hypothetical protein
MFFLTQRNAEDVAEGRRGVRGDELIFGLLLRFADRLYLLAMRG